MISGNLAIPSGITLTIDAGSIFKVKAIAGDAIKVDGTLNANGTSKEPIVFTSFEDPQYGGVNKITYWGQFAVTSKGVLRLDYTQIKYSGLGKSNTAGNAIYCLGTLRMNNSTIENSKGNGIVLSTVIQPLLKNNSFINNVNYSVNNSRYSTMTIDATNNYWGSAAGPALYNTTTKTWSTDGGKISEGVDYVPYYKEPTFSEAVEDENVFSEEEIYKIAQDTIGNTNGEGCQIIRKRVPLVDAGGNTFAFAVPFVDSTNTRAGHINVGALKDGLSFYIIDPYVNNYTNIKEYAQNYDIMYVIPFAYYYVDSNRAVLKTKTSTMYKKDIFTEDSGYFNEDNYESNTKLLDRLNSTKRSTFQSISTYAAPTVAQLSSEANGNKQYVKVFGKDMNGNDKLFYGGDQTWMKNIARDLGKNPRTGKDGSWIAERGCGVAAMTDNILYQIRKDYRTYKDLLNVTDGSKSDLLPEYDYTVFNKTIPYNPETNIITQNDYLDLYDFYCDLTSNPGVAGMNGADMKGAFSAIENRTNFHYTTDKPSNLSPDTTESFIVEYLNQDVPVMFLNFLEELQSSSAETRYLINDPEQGLAKNIDQEQNFDNHWMVITKYYKDNNTGQKFIAIATWGDRISVNLDLLRYNGTGVYYPSFYIYQLKPK